MIPRLTVIEASAGTGKTFSLVTRLLKLIFSGTSPERIVALTFSRMAAGEIFNSFIERLSKAAADGKTAAEESARLGKALSRADFAAKLREVISRQHLSLIGTLDSFLMKVVRMMPLELGLSGELSVMSDFRTPVERMRLVGEMMMRETEETKDIFRQAFRLAFGNAGAKGFLGSFSQFIDDWHLSYRDLCDPGAWGDSSRIWKGSQPKHLDATLAEIRAFGSTLDKFAGKKGADTFIAAVKNFSGTLPSLPKALAGESDALKAIALMEGWKIAKALHETQGIFLLMHAYESAYASKVRARGLITFDDMPRLINSLPEGIRLPLEYRMDARFDHWALDEFQDTSRGQWQALKNLIGEASQPGSGKSVFIVGDRKQSIYEWRGGDVEILGREAKRAEDEEGCLLEKLDESRRYVPVISKAVTRVFGEGAVMGALDMDDAPESAKWKCGEHKSHDAEAEGFVEVIQAVKSGRMASVVDFFAPVENALMAVKPWERGITTAILVRTNKVGEALLAHLKSRGLGKVVFEGESSVADCPVLSAMTELVKLAEHSKDVYAYAHIKASPLAEALYPDGLPDRADLSARLLSDFTRIGMVRKFREAREALKSIPGSWNAFTESRFEDFIKCAAEFEEMRDSSMRLSDFIEYLSHKTRRDFAEPGMVRIMTMHQSKGLGFDWVIVPFYEPEKMSGEHHLGPLNGEDWILSNPGVAVDMSDPALAKAERTREQIQIYNSLCLDYVAMTRAKRALTIILHPRNAKAPSVPEKFSDLVRLTGLETAGDPEWYLKLSAPKASETQAKAKPSFVRAKREKVMKSRPSESWYSGLKGDVLFEDDFGAAAKRGSEAHAKLELIEWGEGEAFAKPSPEATVWRERGYELYLDGKWESGRFDRVVFTGSGEGRKAVIYDFKTGSNRDESVYSVQMEHYRRALSALTGISLANISAKICFIRGGNGEL